MQKTIAHFEYNTSTPIVKVSQKDFTFNLLVDTGCNISCISKDILKKLICKSTGEKTTSVLYASGEESGELDIYAAPIIIGSMLFEDYFNIIDMTQLSERLKSELGVEIDGLMGNNFLSQYGLTIDFKKRILKYVE